MGRRTGIAVAVGVMVLGTGCRSASPPPGRAAGRAGSEAVRVEEAFVSAPVPADNTDSVAPAARYGWVIATAKGSHQLVVLDAETGAEVRRVGGPGDAAGELRRPNGIAVAGDLVLVVERDNARVQVFRLPELEAVGTFGDDVLERPYGLAVLPTGDEGLTVWVTDAIELSDAEERGTPRRAQLVERFDLRVSDEGLVAAHAGTLGDADGLGAVWMAESVAVDPLRDRLLLADEHARRRHLKVYGLAGGFTGRVVGEGAFEHEPEGIALWPCGDGGYWVATDQQPDRSVFVLLDRDTLEPVARFAGAVTANTDGIGLTTEPVGGMTAGALYAVHDDQAVAAFDLGEVVEALGLDPRCR